MAELSGVGLAVMVGGGLLVYGAVKDFTPLSGLRALAGGKPPATAAQPHTSGLTDQTAAVQAILTGTSSGGAPAMATAGTGSAIADAALKYQGVPYRYGGADPSGFDCSGLIFYVLGHDLGVRGAPRTIGALALWPGATTIGASQQAAGDLVLWPYGVGPNAHGGIVVSPGQYINAPHTGTDVQIDPIPASLHGGPPVYRRVNAQGGMAV